MVASGDFLIFIVVANSSLYSFIGWMPFININC